MKKCHVAAYCRQIKQLLGLIEENRKFILNKRSAIQLELHNIASATESENRIKTEGTEIAKFYASWIKIHEAQKLRLLNKKEEELTLPVVRRSKKQKRDEEDAEDSEEESEFELRLKGEEDTKETTERSSNRIKTKPEKSKQKKKQKIISNNSQDEQSQEEIPDIVQDINSDDWD